MASSDQVSYADDSDELRINDLVIRDPEVTGFFEDQASEVAVKRALRVGVLALEMAETSREVDYIEQAVAELSHDFQDHIDEFIANVEDQLEANSALIEEELDPRTDGTPTNQLKTDLEDELEQVRTKIGKLMGREDVYRFSTDKGGDFEKRLGGMIDRIALGPFDELEQTGEYEGAIEDCKKGDYVITTENGYRIVIEAKNWTSNLTKSTIKSELDTAIRNRKADAGLLVSRNASAAPQTHIGTFHEFGPKRTYVALCEGPDDEPHRAFLKFAYNWVRIRAQQAQADLASEVDEGWVNEQLQRLKEDVEELQSMRDQAKNIQETAADMEADLHEKEAELIDTIADIRKEVAAS